MFFIVGVLAVIGSVIGGYVGAKGQLGVLWQPYEFLIIFGAAIGATIIANPPSVLRGIRKNIRKVVTGAKYNKDSYMELLGVLYSVFKLAKTKGDLALESHVEKPDESPLFSSFPKFQSEHHSVEFLCDYLRLLTLGTSNAHEVEAVMEEELEVYYTERLSISGAVLAMGDAFPALGIVAAVLGVIHTMGAITEPPDVLGHLIGGALVGTFSGILISYGFASPIGKSMEAAFNAEARYMMCIKTAIVAHMRGYAPQVSVEFARKTLNNDVRPTFAEVEEMISELPSGW